MPAAMRPHSVSVAADSSFKKPDDQALHERMLGEKSPDARAEGRGEPSGGRAYLCCTSFCPGNSANSVAKIVHNSLQDPTGNNTSVTGCSRAA
jgi:hypothetical protein